MERLRNNRNEFRKYQNVQNSTWSNIVNSVVLVVFSVAFWLEQICHASWPIWSTNQIWVLTRHQYEISPLVSQTSTSEWSFEHPVVFIWSIFNNYSTSAHWIWSGYNHLISNKPEWNNCFIKTPTNYREFSPTSFVKTTNFQQTRTVTIFGAWYNGSCNRALELHYPKIQFFLK